MFEHIKKYLEGKNKNLSSIQISDDNVIVLFKKEFELDNSTYPPTVVAKPDEVEFTTTEIAIDEEIAKLQEQIDLLVLFKKELR